MLTIFKPVYKPFVPFSDADGKSIKTEISFTDGENVLDSKTCYVTGFNKEEFFPLPRVGGRYNITIEQQTCFQARFDPRTVNGKKVIDDHEIFETVYEETKSEIFQNNMEHFIDSKSKGKKEMYQFVNCICETQHNKIHRSRLNFNKKYSLFYKGEMLDDANVKMVNSYVFPKGGKLLKGDELKEHKNNLKNIIINYPQGTTNTIKVDYGVEDGILEQKSIQLTIIYRDIEVSDTLKGLHDGVMYISPTTKRPSEYTNEDFEKEDSQELKQFLEDYGQPQINTVVYSPSEVEKFTHYNCYFRYGITYSAYAEKPIIKNIVKFNVKSTCDFVEIINIKEKYVNYKKHNPIDQLYKNSSLIDKKQISAKDYVPSKDDSNDSESDDEIVTKKDKDTKKNKDSKKKTDTSDEEENNKKSKQDSKKNTNTKDTKNTKQKEKPKEESSDSSDSDEDESSDESSSD